jgi:hypothetical protein
VKTPGSDKLLGTFTDSTTPNASQAQAVIDQVVGVLPADTGPLPATKPDVLVAARTACEWRAAADIEIAYPNRDADVQVYAQLNQRAADSYSLLLRVLSEAGAGQADTVPSWGFPPPVRWGDQSPGSGVDPLIWPDPWREVF